MTSSPVGLIAQFVRALHRYRKGHGFESCISLIFSSGFLFATAEVASITLMIIFSFKSLFISQFLVVFSYIHYFKSIVTGERDLS